MGMNRLTVQYPKGTHSEYILFEIWKITIKIKVWVYHAERGGGPEPEGVAGMDNSYAKLNFAITLGYIDKCYSFTD
jgi:hypothetical protein